MDQKDFYANTMRRLLEDLLPKEIYSFDRTHEHEDGTVTKTIGTHVSKIFIDRMNGNLDDLRIDFRVIQKPHEATQ